MTFLGLSDNPERRPINHFFIIMGSAFSLTQCGACFVAPRQNDDDAGGTVEKNVRDEQHGEGQKKSDGSSSAIISKEEELFRHGHEVHVTAMAVTRRSIDDDRHVSFEVGVGGASDDEDATWECVATQTKASGGRSDSLERFTFWAAQPQEEPTNDDRPVPPQPPVADDRGSMHRIMYPGRRSSSCSSSSGGILLSNRSSSDRRGGCGGGMLSDRSDRIQSVLTTLAEDKSVHSFEV